MKFLIFRASQGAVSKDPPCRGAVHGEEAPAFPGEYEWFVELNTVEELLTLLNSTGGGLGLFAPEEDEEVPGIEIFDEDEDED
jgi:hypothetical protein